MENAQIQKLIFIYNADSGIKNVIFDGAHKIFSPETYNCSLCSITYGAFKEDIVWKKFRKESEVKMDFLHKDEFRKAYASKFGHKFSFPVVLAETNNGLEIFINTEELNKMEDAKSLIKMTEKRLVV